VHIHDLPVFKNLREGYPVSLELVKPMPRSIIGPKEILTGRFCHLVDVLVPPRHLLIRIVPLIDLLKQIIAHLIEEVKLFALVL